MRECNPNRIFLNNENINHKKYIKMTYRESIKIFRFINNRKIIKEHLMKEASNLILKSVHKTE